MAITQQYITLAAGLGVLHWHAGREPLMYHYRDKHKKEIDLLFEHNQTLYPIVIKKSGSPSKDWGKHFSILEKLKQPIGKGVVISMTSKALPLDENNLALPVTIL